MEQKYSPALQAKLNFQNIINQTSPKNEDGKNKYYTTSLKKNEYDTKDGSHITEQTFSLRNRQNEQVDFALTNNGVLKHATYIHWNEKQPERTFLAKDLEKLKEIVRDPGLAEMAGKFDWSKSKEKEQEQDEIDLD